MDSGWLITENIHYITRLPLFVIILVLFGLAPILFVITVGTLKQWITGKHYDEGNNAIAALGWLFLVTVPVSVLGALVLLIVVIRDTILLYFN